MVLLAGTKTEFAMSRESSVLELHEKVVEHGKTINVLPSGHQILLYREADILDFHENVFSDSCICFVCLMRFSIVLTICTVTLITIAFDKPSKYPCSRICNESDIGDTFDRQMVLASIVAPLVVEQDLSRFNIRFQLPMDLKRIEPLSGLAYLAVFCVLEKTLKNYYEEKYRAVTAKKSGMKKRELLEGLKQILGDLAVPLYKSVVVNLFDDEINVSSAEFVGICCYCYRIISLADDIGGTTFIQSNLTVLRGHYHQRPQPMRLRPDAVFRNVRLSQLPTSYSGPRVE